MHASNALSVPAKTGPRKGCSRQISSPRIISFIYSGLLVLLRTYGRNWLGVISGIGMFEEGVLVKIVCQINLGLLSLVSVFGRF